MVGSWQLYVSYDQPYGDPPGHLCEMLHKLYIGRATKGENFTKTMKRERESKFKRRQSSKRVEGEEEKSDKKDKKEGEKEEKVNL